MHRIVLFAVVVVTSGDHEWQSGGDGSDIVVVVGVTCMLGCVKLADINTVLHYSLLHNHNQCKGARQIFIPLCN